MSRTMIATACLCVLLACWIPESASATGWDWPLRGEVVQEYGATYQGRDGGSCTHGGIDIAGDPGDLVRACVGGEVVFAGKIPAGEGAQALAVTVLTADGLRVTYLPLRSAHVSKGSRVDAGDTLGALASEGDASSAAVHLHLGVRRGEVRLDPAAFLGGSAFAETPEPGPAPARASAPIPAAAHAVSAAAAQSAPTAVAAGSPAPQLAPQGTSVIAPTVAGSPSDALGESLRSAASALTRVPTLRRVAPVAERSVLNTERVWADVTSGRGWLSRSLICLGLLLIAGACVLGVVRSVRPVEAGRIPAAALARRSVR